MIPPLEESPPSRRPWLVLGAALLAGFVAAGSFATSTTSALIFIFSLAIAVFLGTLAQSILTAPPPQKEEQSEGVDSIGLKSV